MSRKYCPTCGAPHEYNLTEPKFCSQCGGGFGALKLNVSKGRRVTEENDEEDEDSDCPSSTEELLAKVQRTGLKVKIDAGPNPRVPLSSLASQEPDLSFQRDVQKLSKKGRKALLEQERTKLRTTVRQDTKD